MVKFDSDYAIFGTFAAEIIEGIPLAESVISYTNDACTKLYRNCREKLLQQYSLKFVVKKLNLNNSSTH